MNFTKTTILALSIFLAKSTEAASLRGQADRGEDRDLRQLQLLIQDDDVDLQSSGTAEVYSNFIQHTTGGCMGRNELGSIKNFEVDPQPNGHATKIFGDDYDFGKKNHYTMADCVEMCDSHDECVSVEYSKTAGSNGKTCSLSTTCDSYRKTVKTENSSNFFFLKRTPDTEAALPCYYEPITVSGEQFKQLVNTCINIGEAELLEGWKTGAVTNMAYAFEYQSEFNIDISKWDTAAVTDMGRMFLEARAFNQDIGDWNTAKVTNMSVMFMTAHAFNQNIGKWNTGEVKYMTQMFNGAQEFNQNIGDWDTSKVSAMWGTFAQADKFNQNIGKWDTAKVVSMGKMFRGADAFNQNIGNWNTAKVTNMKSMFWEASEFNQDISGWDTSKVHIDSEMLGLGQC